MNQKLLLFIIWVLPLFIQSTALPVTRETSNALSVEQLRLNYLKNPIGTDDPSPRFFWVLKSELSNTVQTTYRLQVSLDKSFSDDSQLIWDTGTIRSNQSIQVSYAGEPLQSATRYFWRVMVSDNHGNDSDWSQISWWETGLLNPDEWAAKWITTPWPENPEVSEPITMLRNEFSITNEIATARLYASAYGLYEVEINGQKVGNQVFTPGWTSYPTRVQYQTYDITNMLQRGNNAIGAYLGDGWFRGFIGWGDQRNYYGEQLAFIAQIHVTYTNGQTETFATNSNWKASKGPILHSDIYNGEAYDARKEMPGWSRPGYNDRDWMLVKLTDVNKNTLIAPQAPTIRKIQELKPIEMFVTPQGDTVLDMGQNLIGWIRFQVNGPAGTRVVLRHAETLDKFGNFYTENLRSADQTNSYILKGDGIETWQPRFTFQGFRYVAVSGWPGELKPEDFTGVVIHSDMEPTGHFDCSHPLVNKLQHNIVWGQKGNFLDVPTDCPQRDERMGWTGDIQVFANTANINMNTAAFLNRWLRDLEADQFENGAVPYVVPNVLGPNPRGAAGWGDAVAIVPWSLYQAFADTLALETQFESILRWIGYIKERAALRDDPYIWNGDYQFGDWLAFATVDRPAYAGSYTHTDFIATAYFLRSTSLALEMARILNKRDQIQKLEVLYLNIWNSFQNEFVTPNGRLSSDTQTAYLLALRYNLLPDDLRLNAANYLRTRINRWGHLTTGFLGTPHLNHVLSEFGFREEAYNLLLRENYPSWLYPVTMGATTIWERWDGIKPDSTFQSPGMNSFNHYAYGAIGEWLFTEVAGIKSSKPGYQSLAIAPQPGGGLNYARAIQKTLYGKVSSSWQFTNEDFLLSVEVPANTNAQIQLPFEQIAGIQVNGLSISGNSYINSYNIHNGQITIDVGSGEYQFRIPKEWFPESALPTGESESHKELLSKESKVAHLLAHETSRAILFEKLPDLMESPWLSQVMNFSLQRSMECLPQELKVSIEQMNEIDSQLRKIKY